jgi:hypothetical protein
VPASCPRPTSRYPAVESDSAFKVGRDAIELSFAKLIPHLGEPVAVQRKVEYTLAPGHEWLSGASAHPSTTSTESG